MDKTKLLQKEFKTRFAFLYITNLTKMQTAIFFFQ